MATPTMFRVVEREARIFRRTWRGSVFTGFFTPVMFLAAMGLGLGDLVDERTGTVEGLSYAEFVTPGILVAAAMQTAAGSALWPVMAGFKWMGQYHGVVATPISPSDIHVGVTIWSTLRTLLFSACFLVVAAALGGIPSAWGVVALPAAGLCGMAFASVLAAYTATQETDLTFSVIMRLVVMPLFLFSGTFFPVELLPDWLEGLAVLSPLWHAVEIARDSTTGTVGVWPSVGHAAVLLGVTGVGIWWGRRTFARRMTP